MLAHRIVGLLPLAALDHQDHQVASEPLLDLLDFVLAKEVFGADVGVDVELGDVVQVCALPVPFIGLSHWGTLTVAVLVYFEEEVDLLVGELLDGLVLVVSLFLLEDGFKAVHF